MVILGISVGSGGFRPSISESTVSAIQMEPAGFRVFRMRAALSGEDGGAPVFSREGEVIGMVAAPVAEGGAVSVIPINYLRGLLTR